MYGTILIQNGPLNKMLFEEKKKRRERESRTGASIPAHDPYFLRFILDIPKEARKKAQKSPARVFRALNVNQDSHRTPTTAIIFL